VQTTRQRTTHADGGFSVIEAIIALGVISAIIVILSAALASGLRAAMNAKILQQATALGDEAVEEARALPYSSLALRAVGDHHGDTDADGRLDDFCVDGDASCADGVDDVTQDGRITTDLTFDPDEDGLLLAEPLALSDTGAVFPHITRDTVGETTYTVYRYVTYVDANLQGGIQRDHKRIVALVTWPVGDRTLSYSASTFIADVKRGVEVTKFSVAPLGAETVAAADSSSPQQVWFTHVVSNDDLPEVFDLTVTGLPVGWTLAGFYGDSGPNSAGYYDPDDGDELLTDTDASGVPDTGHMEIDSRRTVYVVLDIPAAQPAGSHDITFSLTPRLDAGAGAMLVTDTVNVQ